MKLTIVTEPDGNKTVTFSPDAEFTLDLEPNAFGENPHLYATIEHDGETYEGPLPPQTLREKEGDLVIKTMPRKTWDLLYQTLSLDAESISFEKSLRDDLSAALATVHELNPPPRHS